MGDTQKLELRGYTGVEQRPWESTEARQDSAVLITGKAASADYRKGMLSAGMLSAEGWVPSLGK